MAEWLNITKEEHLERMKLYNEGFNDVHLAKKVNSTPTKIGKWRKEYNLKPNRCTMVNRKIIKGKNYTQCADCQNAYADLCYKISALAYEEKKRANNTKYVPTKKIKKFIKENFRVYEEKERVCYKGTDREKIYPVYVVKDCKLFVDDEGITRRKREKMKEFPIEELKKNIEMLKGEENDTD